MGNEQTSGGLGKFSGHITKDRIPDIHRPKGEKKTQAEETLK